MWTQPRKTIRAIVDKNPRHQLLLIAILGGMVTMLNRSMNQPIGDTLPLSSILLAIVMLGAVAGIAKVYIYGWLLRWTGKYVGGKATLPELRAAIAWPAVPLVWGLLAWIPAIALYHKEWFSSYQPGMAQNPLLPLFFILLSLVLSLWSIILTLKTLSEVQRFSIWKAALNGLLAGIIVAIITFGLSLIFGSLLAAMGGMK